MTQTLTDTERAIYALNDAKLEANLANLTRTAERVAGVLEELGLESDADDLELLATRTQDRTAHDVDMFRQACARIASRLFVESLNDGTHGDEAGELLDAGRPVRVEITAETHAIGPSTLRRTIEAAIPNRATGGKYATSRVRLSWRAWSIPVNPVETRVVDVVGVADGYGPTGDVLVVFDEELPVKLIPLSWIVALEPVTSATSIGFAYGRDAVAREVDAGRACGLHDRPLPCLECL